jgi:Uma2 family endonuclease
MAETALKKLNLEEFFDWCPADDRRWELIDGVPVAMAPAGGAHARLLTNLVVAVDRPLADRRPCSVLTGAGVVRPDRADSFLVPDMLVSCLPVRSGDRFAPDPVLICEVLSRSTADHDRQVKVPIYLQIPTIQEILLIDPARLYAEVLRRLDEERWLIDLAVAPDARVRLDSVGLDIALNDLYAGVPLGNTEIG